jgi:hypothetical protein
VAALTGGLASEVRDAVTGRCKRAGAVQGARLRRRSRTGAGSVKGLDGVASCSSWCCFSSSSWSSSPLVRRRRKWEIVGRLGFATRSGATYAQR